MKLVKRFVEDAAFSAEIKRQMRFIAGPRQSGKTTIAKNTLKKYGCEKFYYNWDSPEVRSRYRKDPGFLRQDAVRDGVKKKAWVCFDEIHKMHQWKNILKGMFDEHEDKINFIVTGSARLDVLKKAGDSLMGRYFQFKLNPLMLAEVSARKTPDVMPGRDGTEFVEKAFSAGEAKQGMLEDFLKLSAFPEPLLSGRGVVAAKWHADYYDRVTKEDLRDISAIHSLGKVLDLLHMLPSKIGSPLSINSLREDLELNHNTVKTYMDYLGLLYVVFQLQPYTRNISRAVRKEKKTYLYNYAVIENEAARFENFVALELKSRVDLWNDSLSERYGLHYIRNREGKETDFLVTKNSQPFALFEAKLSDVSVEPHHRLNAEKLGSIPFVQVVKKEGVLKKETKNIFIASASRFFA